MRFITSHDAPAQAADAIKLGAAGSITKLLVAAQLRAQAPTQRQTMYLHHYELAAGIRREPLTRWQIRRLPQRKMALLGLHAVLVLHAKKGHMKNRSPAPVGLSLRVAPLDTPAAH